MNLDPTKDATISLVQHAVKRFYRRAGSLTALDNFSLHTRSGDCLVLLGPNACGKSTLLRIMLGLETLDAGSLDLPPTDRNVLGCVLQDYRAQLLPQASLSTNLRLALGGRRGGGLLLSKVESITREVLGLLGHELSFGTPVGQLSGGQQQAFVVARACAYEPQFYIWDEPTSAMDAHRQLALYRFLRRRWQLEGASAIWITHDLDEAFLIADRIVVLNSQMKVVVDADVQRDNRELDWSFLETEIVISLRRRIRQAADTKGPKQ